MLKSKIIKFISILLLFPGKYYKDKGYELINRVKNLIKTVVLLGVCSLIFVIIMLITGAYTVALISVLFFFITSISYVLVRRGYYKTSSYLVIVSLFLAFVAGVNMDQYINIYELYVFGTFSLVLTLVTCLVCYTRKQLILTFTLNILGLTYLFYTEVIKSGLNSVNSLDIQSLFTVTVLIVIGTLSALRVYSLQNKMVRNLNNEKSQVDRMLRITEVYTKKSLVSIISKGGDPTTFIPQGKEIAVQFCDIRDFTSFSENMNADDTIRLLNSFFNRMNVVIQNGQGEIDKLIGDCIMASFDRCQDAVNTSIDMARELQKYNRERVSYSLQPIHTGTGIGFGKVAVGNIGSSNKMDYTVIGDVVNVSSRLESLTKLCGVDIIISENVYERIPDSEFIRYLGEVMVKGRWQPIKIYEVFTHELEQIKEKKLSIKPRFDEAIELYNNHLYSDATRIYRELIRVVGPHSYKKGFCKDPVLQYFLGLCLEKGFSNSNITY